MCGVLGMFAPEPRQKHLLSFTSLFAQSKIRGLHAFGFACPYNDGILAQKSRDLTDIQTKVLGLKHSPPEILIGHTRYSTSGDYKDISNNQPVLCDDVALVFNGVISQATREENERIYKKRFVTENDGEIFARKVIDGEDWIKFVADGKFSFAGIFIRNGEAYAIRNKNRPLWIGESFGAAFFASTRDIFIRAGSFEKVKEVPIGKPIKLDERLLS